MIDLVPDHAPAALSSTRSAPPKTSHAQTPANNRGATAAAASGSGSILSFFARQAAAPKAINPAKVVKASARVSLVETRKENVPPTGTGTSEEPKRVSKFFGGSASKGKAAAMDIADAAPQRVDVITAGAILRNEAGRAEVEHGQDDDCDDLEAEAALRDIELCVELRSQSDRSPITPPAHDVAVSEHGDAQNNVDKELSPRSEDAEERSRQKVESVAPSPALETPSPVKTSRQSDRPDECSEDGGISSPACSTSAQAGWQPMAANSPDILSSPIAAKPRSPVELLVPKKEADLKPAQAVSPPFPLTSDPIVLSSDADIDAACANSTPRPPKRSPRPPKARKSSPLSSRGKAKAGPVREGRALSLAVWEDTPRTRSEAPSKIASSSRQKPKKRSVEEKAPEGASDAVKAVAASWRAKFMLPAASKVCAPLSTSSSAPRFISLTNAVQTPQQTMKRDSKLPPTPQTAPTLGAPTVGTRPADKRLATTSAAVRLPLSPRSVNPVSKRSASLVLDKTNPESRVDLGSPPKQRRTISALDVSSAQSSDALESPSSSSPAAVTNPRLLAFKFSGFVRRNSLA